MTSGCWECSQGTGRLGFPSPLLFPGITAWPQTDRRPGWVPRALSPASLHCLPAVSHGCLRAPFRSLFPFRHWQQTDLGNPLQELRYPTGPHAPVSVNTALTSTAAAAPPVLQTGAKMLPVESHAGPSLGLQGVCFASWPGLRVTPAAPAS